MERQELLPFSPMSSRRGGPDLAFAALPLLRSLASRLVPAFAFAQRLSTSTSRWCVPPTEFFHHPSPPRRNFDDTPEAVAIARRHPDLAQAWADLDDLLDDVLTLASESTDVRHAARAIPELPDRLKKLAPWHRKCRALQNLLALVDDEVFTVILPHQRRGWRVHVRGLADLGQLHVLLADALGPPMPDAIVEACRGQVVNPDDCVATIRWQFYRPEAIVSGRLPDGFTGSDHWLWERDALAAMPRVLVAGPPIYPRQWLVPWVRATAGSIELLAPLARTTLDEWLGQTARLSQAA